MKSWKKRKAKQARKYREQAPQAPQTDAPVNVPVLTQQDLSIFKMTEHKLLEFAAQQLQYVYKYARVVNKKDYVYAEGQIPILLMAHVDTVHRTPVKTLVYDNTQGVLWSPEGIGADDRAGVLGIFELLRRGLRPHVLFVDGEESGGIGVRAFMWEFKNPGVQYVIELDRKNGGEAVFYDCDNPSFTRYVLEFGFKEDYGSFTDIVYLCPEWGVAGVNLSTGYYGAHTNLEYLVLSDLWRTLNRVERMLLSPPENCFKYIASYKPIGRGVSSYYGGYTKYDKYEYGYAGYNKYVQGSPQIPVKTYATSTSTQLSGSTPASGEQLTLSQINDGVNAVGKTNAHDFSDYLYDDDDFMFTLSVSAADLALRYGAGNSMSYWIPWLEKHYADIITELEENLYNVIGVLVETDADIYSDIAELE